MWDDNLDRMNENKKGKPPYSFPDSFILVIGYIREYIFTYLLDKHKRNHKRTVGKNLLPDHTSYSQICRRINKLNITSNRLDNNNDNDGIIIAIDSKGIKVTNRGQWMQEKWQIKKKKGCMKIRIAQ